MVGSVEGDRRREAVMGRAERRRRARKQREAEWARGARAEAKAEPEAEAEAYAKAEREADEFFAKMKWDDDDVPERRRESEGNSAGAWEAAQLGTTDQVALLFQVHRKTVDRWRKKAGLPFKRAGGVIRYDLRDIVAWASGNTEGALPPVTSWGEVEEAYAAESGAGPKGGDGDGVR